MQIGLVILLTFDYSRLKLDQAGTPLRYSGVRIEGNDPLQWVSAEPDFETLYRTFQLSLLPDPLTLKQRALGALLTTQVRKDQMDICYAPWKVCYLQAVLEQHHDFPFRIGGAFHGKRIMPCSAAIQVQVEL
jgi:hypothetical protein